MSNKIDLKNVPTLRQKSRRSRCRPSRRRASARNLKITLEYDGTDYCGWQIQSRYKKKPSIQSILEKTLKKILREKIKVIGSGRTDAGVHARAQVANFRTKSRVPLKKLQLALNGNLPEDIVVTEIEEVAALFHSCFDAVSKVYRYTILNRRYPSAALRKSAYFCSYPLDIKLMRQEAGALLGKHDFKAFQAVDNKERSSVRAIKKLKLKKEGDLIYVDIEADGFLYNMARNIVGTLIEIGRGRFPKGSLTRILAAEDRKLAGPTLPACGLSLIKVRY